MTCHLFEVKCDLKRPRIYRSSSIETGSVIALAALLNTQHALSFPSSKCHSKTL